MAWVATDQEGKEGIYGWIPARIDTEWYSSVGNYMIKLPKGSIRKLIGRDLTWDDEPVELI